MSQSVIPASANGVPLIARSKSAECSLDDVGHVPRRPTTPITYTNLLNWRRGEPQVYVINGNSPADDHVTSDVMKRSTTRGSKRSSGQHMCGKMSATSEETVTSLEQSAIIGQIMYVLKK